MSCEAPLERLVPAVTLVEERNPLATVVADADLVALSFHPVHHVADAAPRVEPAVEQPQLGFGRRYEGEADSRRADAAALTSEGRAASEAAHPPLVTKAL